MRFLDLKTTKYWVCETWTASHARNRNLRKGRGSLGERDLQDFLAKKVHEFRTQSEEAEKFSVAEPRGREIVRKKPGRD